MNLKLAAIKQLTFFLERKFVNYHNLVHGILIGKTPAQIQLITLRISAYILVQETSIFREGLQPLKYGYLTREVVAVDLEPSKLLWHVLDYGQKYHFLRRNDSKVSIKDAHEECVEFIYQHIANWISIMNRVFYSYKGILPAFGFRKIDFQIREHLRRDAASELALSLHALQDSFSSGHTKRSSYTDAEYPGAINDIYIYN